MYRIKTSERNNDKATEYETKSLLYLLTKIKGHRTIDLFIIDCLNDVTGVAEGYKDSWDIQSKNVASLIYADTIRTYSDDEKRLSELRDKADAIQAKIDLEQRSQDTNTQSQKNVKSGILDKMNGFYKLIDPDGQQVFKDLFATRSMTFSGSEEQEYYFSRTLAIYWYLKHSFPIIMDCFRKGELSSKKEKLMIEEYKKTGLQVILSSTLKDEEYSSGGKYYNMDGVNAINYETNQNSHILQEVYCEQFMSIVDSFGVIMQQ